MVFSLPSTGRLDRFFKNIFLHRLQRFVERQLKQISLDYDSNSDLGFLRDFSMLNSALSSLESESPRILD